MTNQLKTLTGPGHFFKLLKNALKAVFKMAGVPRKDLISPDFGEKIFLAVCGVNQCLYCTWLHTRTALEAGLDQSEIDKMLSGDFKGLKEDEAAAVLYAQHWADTDGNISLEARRKVLDKYGKNKTAHIETNINVVYLGNLCSNTVHSYKEGTLKDKQRFSVKIAYFLALPVAAVIRKGSGK